MLLLNDHRYGAWLVRCPFLLLCIMLINLFVLMSVCLRCFWLPCPLSTLPKHYKVVTWKAQSRRLRGALTFPAPKLDSLMEALKLVGTNMHLSHVARQCGLTCHNIFLTYNLQILICRLQSKVPATWFATTEILKVEMIELVIMCFSSTV